MQGFFKKEDIKISDQEAASRSGRLSCYTCGLYKNAQSPKMEPYGNFKKNIMVIGEAPGEVEDRKDKPWQGRTGRLLQRTLDELGINLFEDCVSLNAVNCRPPDNQTPTGHHLNCCRSEKVLPAIEEYNPNIIIPLGGPAVTSLIGHRWKKNFGGITKWRGWQIPDRDYKAWICPAFHPSYVERMNAREVDIIWEQDLKAVLGLVGTKLPQWPKPTIHYIEDLEQLRDMKYQDGWRLIAPDYETTGLKPHKAGHRIVCAAVACGENEAYVFPMPDRKQDRQPFIELMQDPQVDKIASNLKFEDQWSKIRLGVDVKGWLWDTMLAAHVLDNRPGITSLKFQAYVNLGVVDYDSDVSDYLKALHANDQNKIYKLADKPGGMRLLMEYCALDAIYEYRLAKIQMKKLDHDFLPF